MPLPSAELLAAYAGVCRLPLALWAIYPFDTPATPPPGGGRFLLSNPALGMPGVTSLRGLIIIIITARNTLTEVCGHAPYPPLGH